MKLDEKFNGICSRYLEITAQYDKMTAAFKAFCDEKNKLSALLLPHDTDDGQDPANGTTPEPYPSEAGKAQIRKTISAISDVYLASMLRFTKPDLGALSDEMRMVFIAQTVLDEASKRLAARKGAQ